MDEISSCRSSLKFKQPRADAISEFPIGHGRFPVAEPPQQNPATKAASRNNSPPQIMKQSVRCDFSPGDGQHNECSVPIHGLPNDVFPAKLVENSASLSTKRKCPSHVTLKNLLTSHDCVARKRFLSSVSLSRDISANSLEKPNSSFSQDYASTNVHGTRKIGSVSKGIFLHNGNSSRDFPKPSNANSKAHVKQMKSDVNLGSRKLGRCHESCSSHDKVRKVLELYRETLAEVFKEDGKSNKRKTTSDYIRAAMLLKRCYKWIYTSKRLGPIPGVEIGDEFLCRAELNVAGLHHQFQNGIDYLKKNGIAFATSIVATDRYENNMGSSNVLIYSGEGGNPLVKSSQPVRDQSLDRGHLALKNSMDSKYPVRVIHQTKFKNSKLSSLEGVDSPKSSNLAYAYDGLYMVVKYWQERGSYGKLVFKFKLERISGQPNSK